MPEFGGNLIQTIPEGVSSSSPEIEIDGSFLLRQDHICGKLGLSVEGGTRMSGIRDSDEWLFRLFNTRIKCRLLDAFSVWVTHTGSAGFTIGITFAAILAGLWQKRSPYLIAGSRALAALASSHLVSHVVKRLVNRPRPILRFERIRAFNVPICAYSFPSGHTTASFAVGVSYAMAFPGYSLFWVFWATLVGWSRIYVGVHYPSDVLAGSVVGTLFAYISRLVVPGFA